MNGWGISRWIWKGLQNNLDFSPSKKSREIRIDFKIDLENCTCFSTDDTIAKSTTNYIVGNFSSIQIDLDYFPDQSGLQSHGLTTRSIWRVRAYPDRSGFGSGLIFTLYQWRVKQKTQNIYNTIEKLNYSIHINLFSVHIYLKSFLIKFNNVLTVYSLETNEEPLFFYKT